MKEVLKLRSSELGVAATAATPIRYQRVFGEDLIVELGEAIEGRKPFVASKLAYIMHKQADEDMATASAEDFERWLDQYEGAEIQERWEDLLRIYYGSEKPAAKSKKK